jgi:hypothetical protein
VRTLVLLFFAAQAVRFPQNPIVRPELSPAIGDNINGPSLVRVPAWVRNSMGRYYLYFAHHQGQFIRLAYADSLSGPWKIHEGGVLQAGETAFAGSRTHIASPDVHIDDANKRFIMYFHGAWQGARDGGGAQRTQSAVSADGLSFQVRPPISDDTYVRVFRFGEAFYGIARLGVVMRSSDPLGQFEKGRSIFEGGPYAGRVRHVALLRRGGKLYVFFSAIGDAPERILVSTVNLTGRWKDWRASEPAEVLAPEKDYECAALPVAPSREGLAEGWVHELRDPAIFEEGGRVFLLYTVCGERGIAIARITGAALVPGPR